MLNFNKKIEYLRKYKGVNMPLSFSNMKSLITTERERPLKLFQLIPSQQPTELVAYFRELKEQESDCRHQCLINMSEHWFTIDVKRSCEDNAINIVILDAAATLRHASSFCFLAQQICSSFDMKLSQTCIATLGAPLQRDGQNCTVFAWEHLAWAGLMTDLHQQLQLLPNDPSHFEVFTSNISIMPGIRTKQGNDQLVLAMSQVKFVDYSSLPLPQFNGFFINKQSLFAEDYQDASLIKWLIEKPQVGCDSLIMPENALFDAIPEDFMCGYIFCRNQTKKELYYYNKEANGGVPLKLKLQPNKQINFNAWDGSFKEPKAIHLSENDVSNVRSLTRTAHTHSARYKIHNIRIAYCKHCMEAKLAGIAPLSEDEFIVDIICREHKKSIREVNLVLRLAVASGNAYQVRALLLCATTLNINDVPGSNKTALDRANSLPETTDIQRVTKDMILRLLQERGAQSAASAVPAGPTSEISLPPTGTATGGDPWAKRNSVDKLAEAFENLPSSQKIK